MQKNRVPSGSEVGNDGRYNVNRSVISNCEDITPVSEDGTKSRNKARTSVQSNLHQQSNKSNDKPQQSANKKHLSKKGRKVRKKKNVKTKRMDGGEATETGR